MHKELHRGMIGNNVILAKKLTREFLIKHGHRGRAARIIVKNPKFGRGLENGIKLVQEISRLDPDGVIGSDTWDVLAPNKKVNRLLKVARSQVGVHEVGGNNRGPQVERYIAAGHGAPGESWCGDFVDWCLLHAGLPVHHTARYVPGLEQWAKAQGRWRVHPSPGYACIMEFDGDSVSDHVGIVERVDSNGVVNIEGNTSPSNSGSQSNGGGVYRKQRPRHLIRGYVKLV